MAYPVLRTSYGATRTPTTGRQTERASNGSVRGRVLYTATKSVFKISHDSLKAADYAAFKAFYSANLAASFAYVYPADGLSYTCIFGADPVETAAEGFSTTVAVELLEV